MFLQNVNDTFEVQTIKVFQSILHRRQCDQIWQKFRHFVSILLVLGNFWGFFTICQNFGPTLAKIICLWVKFLRSKWPKLKNIWSHWIHRPNWRIASVRIIGNNNPTLKHFPISIISESISTNDATYRCRAKRRKSSSSRSPFRVFRMETLGCHALDCPHCPRRAAHTHFH